jgi:hypothetical protein
MIFHGADRTASESQIVIHRDCDLLLRFQVPLRGLYRRVPEQQFNLLKVGTVLTAEFGTRTAQVVRAEVFDPNLLR